VVLTEGAKRAGTKGDMAREHVRRGQFGARTCAPLEEEERGQWPYRVAAKAGGIPKDHD